MLKNFSHYAGIVLDAVTIIWLHYVQNYAGIIYRTLAIRVQCNDIDSFSPAGYKS